MTATHSHTLELVGGPCDGQQYGPAQPWPILGPASTPIRELTGRDLVGYGPARHNGTKWVSEWLYPRGSGRRGWCLLRCRQDTCPNNRRPAPPPPAG